MNHKRTVALSAALALSIGALAFSVVGCGGDASSDNSASIGKLASADGATDLSGTWVFNKDLSDHPRRPDSAGRPDGWQRPDSSRRPDGWQRPDSSGRPDGWRRGDGRRGRGPHADSSREGRRPRGPMTFVIEQTDSTVAITGPREHTRTLYTDGRVITRQRDDDKPGAQVMASWNTEGQLVVTRTGPKGGARIETFSLSADGQQLIIATHADPAGDREARDLRRVFDVATSGN